MKYVIATHGKLADGYASSIKLLLGIENIYPLNAYLENKTDFVDEFIDFMNENQDEKVIVFTDLANGSVTQSLARLKTQYDFVILSGVNLALIMEVLLLEEELTENMIEHILQSAREQMICVNDLVN